ncbi:MAG: ATP-binding protein [Bdellovibrionales bacterium]|nr:ATP-binding protein [Bdellovibrionales bacterium]
MIYRQLSEVALGLVKKYPVLTVIGPRQSGKTTLCRNIFPNLSYTNLEELDVREFARQDPKAFLGQYPEGCIIDEIQRVPELTSYIQVLVDEKKQNGMFVLTGSQNFSIREALGQSLAGRTAIIHQLPFSLEEVRTLSKGSNISLMYKGFYPRVFEQDLNPTQFYQDYLATYVERDLRQLSLVKEVSQFQTFVKLCAGRVGNSINFEKMGNDVGVSQPTAKEWFSLLEASYIVFKLPPYFANIRKRLVKTPKLYFYDVGLACYLLGIESEKHLEAHPLRGALFENMVVAEALKKVANSGKTTQLHYYRDSDGNEIDLLWPVVNHNVPIEVKSGSTIASDYFKNFPSYRKAIRDDVYQGLVVYGGDKIQLRSDCTVTGIRDFSNQLDKIIKLT